MGGLRASLGAKNLAKVRQRRPLGRRRCSRHGSRGAGPANTGSKTLVRFDVYKRALMLTAATVALMSGNASADTTITTKSSNTLQTSSAGNITVTSAGGLVLPSSSTAATVPAIEINSSNNVTFQSSSALTFQGTPSAIGIQADGGNTGEIILQGAESLTGAGTDKTGIQFGTSVATTGTFTGIVDAT